MFEVSNYDGSNRETLEVSSGYELSLDDIAMHIG